MGRINWGEDNEDETPMSDRDERRIAELERVLENMLDLFDTDNNGTTIELTDGIGLISTDDEEIIIEAADVLHVG